MLKRALALLLVRFAGGEDEEDRCAALPISCAECCPFLGPRSGTAGLMAAVSPAMADKARLVRTACRALGAGFVLMALRLGFGVASAVNTAEASANTALTLQAPLILVAAMWCWIGWAVYTQRVTGLWVGLLSPLGIVLLVIALKGGDLAQAWMDAPLSPAQVLALLIFKWAKPETTVLPVWNWMIWCWLAYLLHALIVMWLMKTIKEGAAGSSPIRAKATVQPKASRHAPEPVETRLFPVPPEIANLYTRNPYAVLGLVPQSTKTRQVVRRRDEMIAVLATGVPIDAALDGYLSVRLPGAPAIDEGDARRAVARIQQDPDRCREALLWFRLEEEPPNVLGALAKGDLDLAEEQWRLRGEADPGAQYNLAVLLHQRVVADEPSSAPPKLPGNKKQWRASHVQWQRALSHPASWDPVERLVSACTDPRVGASFAAELKEGLPSRLLAVHCDLARAAVAGNFLAYARAQLDHVAQSGWPAATVQTALEGFFAPMRDAAKRVLAPVLARGVTLTAGGIDFAALEAEFTAAREPFVRLHATDRLGPLAQEVVSQVKRQVLQETNQAWSAFRDADNDFFSVANK